MELELRGGVRAAPVLGDTPAERQALRWAPDPRERTADPAHIVRAARELEEDGLDSALVVQSSSWPDPWLVAGWALAATSRLRIAAAHRIGVNSPTTAARSLATLDRLSAGRISAHVIIGSSDADVARDGDTLPKAERYRRAEEYLAVLTRYLAAESDLDHDGEYYTLRAARPGLRPSPDSELISFGGSSAQGVELAAKYAQVYAVPPLPLPDTRRRTAEARAAAARHGRTLRIWRHVTVVLVGTDGEAQQRLRRLRRDAIQLATGPEYARHLDAVALDRDRERGLTGPDQIASYIRRNLAAAYTGSPATVAARIHLLRAAGVDIVQLDLATETDEDRALRRQLVALLRNAAPPRWAW
ncbi:LLM class flavin-dependent oxidoreductase [Kitasatospora sp. NPDC004531]